MRNCKNEFLIDTNGKDILCAEIKYSPTYDEKEDKKTVLKIGYSATDLDLFLRCIDFNYDSGYGGQKVYGTVWYKDGTWSERCEYDGSEWWEYKKVPEIPKALEKI